VSLVTAADVNDFLTATFGTISHNCEEVGDGWAVARIDTSGMVLRPGAIISGPTVFGLMDGVITYAAWTRIGVEPMLLTSELSIRYLRPAQGDTLRARAEIHSVGGRNVVGSAVAWTTSFDKPVAVAQGTFVRPRA
jgi:uncharacterized protein (TIGR00369 family)